MRPRVLTDETLESVIQAREISSGMSEDALGEPSLHGLRVPTVDELRRSASGPIELAACTQATDPVFRRDLGERYEPGEDTARMRIRRSWVWVDYARNVLGQAGKRWLFEDVATDVSAENTMVELGTYGVETFAVLERHESRDVGDLYRWVIDEHVEPVLRVASRESKVGMRNLWGSVAAALAGQTIETSTELGVAVPVERLRAFLDGRRELAGKGELVWVDDRADPVVFHRDTCCLWFRVDVGERCGDCVLSTREEVLAAYRSRHDARASG